MSDPSQPTVLVVEDDLSVQHMLATAFGLDGWTVETADDGQEAIDRLLVSVPDLVVLDMMMPRVAGFEVLQAMHDHPVLCDVPRMVYSARDSTVEQEIAASLGAHRWFVKPVAPSDLVAAGRELVAR